MTKEELKKMFSSSDWNDETILRADEIISRIAKEHLGLDWIVLFLILTSHKKLCLNFLFNRRNINKLTEFLTRSKMVVAMSMTYVTYGPRNSRASMLTNVCI